MLSTGHIGWAHPLFVSKKKKKLKRRRRGSWNEEEEEEEEGEEGKDRVGEYPHNKLHNLSISFSFFLFFPALQNWAMVFPVLGVTESTTHWSLLFNPLFFFYWRDRRHLVSSYLLWSILYCFVLGGLLKWGKDILLLDQNSGFYLRKYLWLVHLNIWRKSAFLQDCNFVTAFFHFVKDFIHF